MRHRRDRPLPQPPPLRGIAVDGSNVIADAPAWTRDRLRAVVRWFHGWRPDLPITVFLDDATRRRADAATAAALQQWSTAGIDGAAALRVCGPDERADAVLLQHAQAGRALVVSNDRFFDHAPLREDVVTVQFGWSTLGLQPFAEATWFRRRGQAVRVAMAALQRG